MGRLTDLLSVLGYTLDSGAKIPASKLDSSVFSGFHDVSDSDVECPSLVPGQEQLSAPEPVPDPLANLDGLTSAQPATAAEHDVDLRMIWPVASVVPSRRGRLCLRGLASIVITSLRRRPNAENVKATCTRLLVPSNVPNMTVPETNPVISKALSVGGKVLDARLAHTNGLLLKALVPILRCLSDIGENAGKPISTYLSGFNDSLRLLVSAFNYLNHLRTEVARIHVSDSALTELCKWEHEVGRDALFPFDVAKKCDEIHKTKRLGRPSFRPYKFGRPQGHDFRQATRRPFFPRAKPNPSARPFLGQKQPRGRRPHDYNHLQ